MSNWIVLLIGLIIGLLIGIIAGRKNYESCREQLNKMKEEIRAQKEKMAQASEKIDEAEHQLDEVTKEMTNAEKMAEAPASRSDEAPEVESAAMAMEETTSEAPETTVGPRAGSAEAAGGEVQSSDVAEKSATESLEKPVTRVPEAIVAAETESAEAIAATVATKIGEAEERITECPQKLARIKGIGRVYEDKLYQAGIGTFWQVATATTEQLAEIFGIKDFQAVDLEAIQQGARALAEETGTVDKIWNGHQPDDLEHLPGIGRTYEGRLYDAGVCTWARLAALTPEELAAIVKAPSWNQPDYAAWIAYAREQIEKSA